MYSPRNIRRLRLGAGILTLILIGTFATLHATRSLDWLENRTADFRAQAALGARHADPNIVIVDIDNASFRTLTADLGRWPWTRRVWTELLNYLARGKPGMVLFDIVFSGEEPAADPGFAQSIEKARTVLLPFAFTSSESELPAKGAPPDKARVEVRGDFPGEPLREGEWELNVPTAALERAMSASGSILGNADADGITRRLPLVERYGGRDYAAFWLASALARMQLHHIEFATGRVSLGTIGFPVDARGRFVARWNGRPADAYKRVPLMEMVCSMHPEICEASVHRHPPEEFAGKIVIVGASAAGSYEVRPTPVSENAPGMFVLATGIDNLLHGDAMRETPLGAGLMLVVLLTVIPALLTVFVRRVAVAGAIAIGFALLYVAVCFWTYRAGLWLPLVSPGIAAFVSLGGNMAYRYFAADRELLKTRRTLEAYVSPQLVSYVMEHIDTFRFDGEKRHLTILFSDVRGFTTIAEHSDPVQLLEQLNEYFEAMTEIVFEHEGILDKFIGDGLMAHWGAFTPTAPNARLAASAALKMLDRLAELNEGWRGRGRPSLSVRIGLNSDDVVFGNVGAGKKLDFTVIGDGVNLASRLEGANKEFGTSIIISESTLSELERADVVPLGEMTVKGKTVAVRIYELRGLRG